MRDIPNHISPTYSDEARDDALFHYTTASGLIGILNANELWSTAYYCANDESELTAGGRCAVANLSIQHLPTD